MAKPILLNDRMTKLQVLNAIVAICGAVGSEYRIVRAESGGEALKFVQEFKRRGDAVALFLVDQRMPGMTGTEFLIEARKLYPDARKVLLTAYADTEAAIQSINAIGLDHYLMKPWDPPEQNLYPVLDDLLSDWQATVELPYEGIRVYGTLWSPTSHTVKDFLSRNQIPYRWFDVEKDAEARELINRLQPDGHRLPVLILPDGETLIQPGNLALAEKVGMHTKASQPFYDLIIVGAGPAGLGAAVYGASEGLRTIMIEKEATGGQAGTSSRIENYLGFPNGLSGADLTRRAVTQARRFGAEILTAQEVVKIRVEDPYRYVLLSDGTELSCQALLIATGVTTRQLDAPGVERLTGAGVYYGATLTEAAYYRDEEVFIVGGANYAGQAAVFFARYARKVTILVRSTSLNKGMSHYLVEQIKAIENIEILTRAEVIEVCGQDKLEAVIVQNADTSDTRQLPAAAMFIFIGAVPHTALCRCADVQQGRIHHHRPGPAPERQASQWLEAEARSVLFGDERAGHLRRRRRARRIDQARGLVRG